MDLTRCYKMEVFTVITGCTVAPALC